MTDIPLCGELLYLPPMHCTKPTGHSGNHSTAMIPEPLSAVAADMVSEHDRLIREREEFHEWRVKEIRRFKMIRIIQYASTIAAIVAVIMGAYSWAGR